jgi:hypothetical protein
MSSQTKMGTISPSKHTATIAWRNALKVVRTLEIQEGEALKELKALRQSLEQARAVARSAEDDLSLVLDGEEPVLPGFGRADEPE